MMVRYPLNDNNNVAKLKKQEKQGTSEHQEGETKQGTAADARRTRHEKERRGQGRNRARNYVECEDRK